jgi:hypothetical protein
MQLSRLWLQIVPLGAFLCVASTISLAQGARETAFAGQPLIYAKEGKLYGCGVRVVGIDQPDAAGQPVLIFDASVQLDLRMRGIFVKATVRRGIFADGNLKVQSTPQVERAWFRSDGVAPTSPKNGTVLPTEEPAGGVMYLTSDMAEDMKTLIAMGTGKTLEIGLKIAGDSVETVRFGEVSLSPAEAKRVQTCLNDLLATPPSTK